MATKPTKVRITWNNTGGELDSVVTTDDGESSLTAALINLIRGQTVAIGDSFTVEEVS